MAGPKLSNTPTSSTPNTHILPCKTFVSIGDCPFRNRCMYIHDMRLQCPKALKTSRAKSRKNEPENDLFYWPSMEGDSTCYVVPSDDPSMYSIWSHFVDFCQECKHHQPKHRKPYAGDEYNQYTHQKRLPIFVKLATTPSGSSLEEAERNKENALPPKNISAHYYKPAPPTGIYQYSHLSSQPSIYYPTTNRSSNVFESPKSIDKTPHFESPIWTPLPSPNC